MSEPWTGHESEYRTRVQNRRIPSGQIASVRFLRQSRDAGAAVSPSPQGGLELADARDGTIHLLQADSELARGLDPARAKDADRRILARTLEVQRGSWDPHSVAETTQHAIGLLVLEGLLMREATVGAHPCAELLGPGDLLPIGDDLDEEELLPRIVEWTALSPTKFAVIDGALAERASQWPSVFATLVGRAARRAERLVVMQAIAHLKRIDDRLLALLWCLAERWGRVSPDGVVVALRLPHRTLGSLVGARRPSVTTALGQLRARGEVERRPDGGWLLLGNPPEPRSQTGEDEEEAEHEQPGTLARFGRP
jgi:CRP/FNR family transcriptional regulator, cyclic AMP receptor protein